MTNETTQFDYNVACENCEEFFRVNDEGICPYCEAAGKQEL